MSNKTYKTVHVDEAIFALLEHVQTRLSQRHYEVSATAATPTKMEVVRLALQRMRDEMDREDIGVKENA